MHCDTICVLQEAGNEESLYDNPFGVSIKKMKQAGTMVQFFACFVQAGKYAGRFLRGKGVISTEAWERAYETVPGMMQRIRREERNEFRLAVSCKEILANNRKGILSGIATVEEGGVLNGRMERLEELYQWGVRLLTLTWNYENCLGYPNSRKREEMCQGLKPFGIEVVEQMNVLGMLVDVSHLSDGSFWDCMQSSSVPIVASHSNARALCDHPRNLTDEMLRALSEKGGVAGLNFYPSFLRKEAQKVTVADLARHASHMIRVAGEDVVAIGTDFDGFEPEEMEQSYISHIGEIDKVREAMKKEGITERQIDKIWSGNIWRVMTEVLSD